MIAEGVKTDLFFILEYHLQAHIASDWRALNGSHGPDSIGQGTGPSRTLANLTP